MNRTLSEVSQNSKTVINDLWNIQQFLLSYNDSLYIFLNRYNDICATLFRALHAAVLGGGMRKKDTEIPPERVFV
jgi:hypothetical protein